MSKFYGKVGFVQTVETSPGIWEPQFVEKTYSGDITTTRYDWKDDSRINSELEINHTVSIVCDKFLAENGFALTYVAYLGRRWKVRKAEMRYPRIVLTLGAEYIMEEGGQYDRATCDENKACCLTS